MNGLRLVLFGVNSDSGFGSVPRQPLAFFMGGATASSSLLLETKLFPAGAEPAREPEEVLA